MLQTGRGVQAATDQPSLLSKQLVSTVFKQMVSNIENLHFWQNQTQAKVQLKSLSSLTEGFFSQYAQCIQQINRYKKQHEKEADECFHRKRDQNST